jgi:hypothetical protein
MEIVTEISLHRSCRTISILAFKKAYCENDYSGLTISGTPTQDELQAAWNEVLFDYSMTVKNDRQDYSLNQLKTIGELSWHVTYVHNVVTFLRHRYESELVDQLVEMGYDLCYDPSNIHDFERQLNRIVSLCKTKVFDLEQARGEYQRMEKSISGKQMSTDEFDDNVAMISQFMRFPIDDELTTMAKYCSYLNNYIRTQSRARS